MGTIGNLNASGNVYTQNSGYINNYNASGTAQMYNAGSVNNLYQTDNTYTFNTGAINNAKLFAGDGDNVGFNNAGFVNNVDADVFSRANTGFINIANSGHINNVDMFDNVPPPPQPVRSSDLITLNNLSTGSINNVNAGTSGLGMNIISNWGAINNLSASGNTQIWNWA
ncbi:MAG: hypothetical protein AB7V50_06885 [Vampirovibrionia bacterium]